MSDKPAQFCPECGRSTLSWCPEFADRVDAAERRTDAAEELARSAEVRAKELEAQCAAMREALKDVQYVLDYVRPFTMQVWGNPACSLEARDLEEVSETVKAALSGDAGRALLERVEALERAASAAQAVKKHGYYGDKASSLDAAVDIMDALEPKR